MEKMYYTPAEITQNVIETGCKKAGLTWWRQLLLGVLAGAFIAFASSGSNVAIHNITAYGVGKALAGALFSTGLMLVLIAGGELFTGNCLMIAARLENKITWGRMLRNWFFVYAGNFIGSLLIVVLIILSGQFDYSHGLLGGFTIKTAAYKTGLSAVNGITMGIMCNWLVCLAVWLSYGAKDMTGKIFGIFFPIWLFITSGFEHSVANMYYIPAGILAKANPLWVEEAMSLGVTQAALDRLNWGNFLVGNLLPVTIGNIIGGGLLVGIAYWLAYAKREKKA